MGTAVNRVVHAALSQAVDDSLVAPAASVGVGVWLGTTLHQLGRRIRTVVREQHAQDQLMVEINRAVIAPSVEMHQPLANAFVIYENKPLGPVENILAVPGRGATADRYFPNYVSRHLELFNTYPPQFQALGDYDPMRGVVNTPWTSEDMLGVQAELQRLELTPRILRTALVQLTHDDVTGEHLRNPVQQGMALGGQLRDAITRYNINELPRQRGMTLSPVLAAVNWDSVTVPNDSGEIYDRIVACVRAATQLHTHYGRSTHPTPQGWLSSRPYFRALVAAAGHRGLALPRDVMSWLRNFVLRSADGSTRTTPEGSSSPLDTYANPELLAEQAADIAAMANIRVTAPNLRKQRTLHLDT